MNSSINQSASLDAHYIKPFVDAVVTVIETMSQVKLTRQTPFIKRPGVQKPVPVGDITGIVAMNSDRYVGSMALCFQEPLMLEIFNKMIGGSATSINDDVKDAVAELTNIVFGHAKRDLNALGHSIKPAIPTVITGKNHEVRHSVEGLCVVIPFESIFGHVLVEAVTRPLSPQSN